MKNSELLELVGKKVSFEVHEDMHIGENKTVHGDIRHLEIKRL